MDLSIIIPSFNTSVLLNRCIASIYQSLTGSPLSFEIIVVDNASKDDTKNMLSKKYPRVITVFNKTNIGYGKANNLGLSRSKGEYILLLNSDTEVVGKGIDTLYAYVASHPKTFIGGKLLNTDGSAQASAGPFYTIPNVFLMLLCKGDSLGITRYSPKRRTHVDWISGACIMGHKKDFMEVGMFDGNIFMYMEEIDFFYRAKKTGFVVTCVPEARFIHAGAASSGTRKEPVLQIYRGLLYFYGKHRSIIEQRILRVLLLLKACLGIVIGRLTGNTLLSSTYEQALTLGLR